MARRMLNELKWHPNKVLKNVRVTYIHRGAPGNRRTINSEDIVALERSFILISMEKENTRIPYHRITEIEQDNIILWRRKA
jgi:hypothetical protein